MKTKRYQASSVLHFNLTSSKKFNIHSNSERSFKASDLSTADRRLLFGSFYYVFNLLKKPVGLRRKKPVQSLAFDYFYDWFPILCVYLLLFYTRKN